MRGERNTAGEKIAILRTTFAGVTLGVLLVIGLGVTSTPAQRGLGVVPQEGAERRVALVIGNAAYDAAIGRLCNNRLHYYVPDYGNFHLGCRLARTP